MVQCLIENQERQPMKAYWNIDATVIQEFDSVEDAEKALNKAPEIVDIFFGAKLLRILKEEISIMSVDEFNAVC